MWRLDNFTMKSLTLVWAPSSDDYKLAKDELTRALNIDWNTTRKPLVSDDEFINKSLNDKLEVDKGQSKTTWSFLLSTPLNT